MAGPRILAASTLVAVGAAAALAFVTIHPPPLKTKVRGPKGGMSAAVAAPPTPPAASTPAPPTSMSTPTPAPAPDPATSESPREPDFNAASLRARAEAKDIPAMEELGRRLIQGQGLVKDPLAGAGWLLRAAEAGSAQSAFNIAVMYERGFVVERDSTKAAQWYRKAADAGLAAAKHNLALLLRDGKGVARDGKAAVDLLMSAARQGMSASMFILGDIFERGDAAPRDPTAALAWFAITGEFERQTGRGDDTALAKSAAQRAAGLQRTLTPEELKQAQDLAQAEFKRIVEALAPPKPEPNTAEPNKSAPAASEPSVAAAPPTPKSQPKPDDGIAPWPNGAVDQVRATQQALLDLDLLRDKPDGNLGPMTRTAIRAFQKRSGLRETGEPSKDLYQALRAAVAQRDVVARSPLPTPPKDIPAPPPPDTSRAEAAKGAAAKAEAPKADPPKPEPVAVETAKPPARLALPPADLPPPPGLGDFARAARPAPAAASTPPPVSEAATPLANPSANPVAPPAASSTPASSASASIPTTTPTDQPTPSPIDPPRPAAPPIDTAKPQSARIETALPPVQTTPPQAVPKIDLGRPEPPPPPPTTADIQRAVAKADPDAWPASRVDQIKAVQRLLQELKFYSGAIDGLPANNTRNAIREYERLAGIPPTGEPTQSLFDSLKEMRKLMAR